MTLATPANMRKFEQAHPGREGIAEDGTRFYVEPVRAIAYSPATLEQYSASSGDYWQHPDDEPLMDAEGNPMILCVTSTIAADAVTGQRI